MRTLIFSGPYNLIAFEVIPAMVAANIIEQPSEEFILSYRHPIAPDRRVSWGIDVPEKGELGIPQKEKEDQSINARLKRLEAGVAQLLNKFDSLDPAASSLEALKDGLENQGLEIDDTSVESEIGEVDESL